MRFSVLLAKWRDVFSVTIPWRMFAGFVLAISGLSGCTYVDPVSIPYSSNYKFRMDRPATVSKVLPGRTLYIRVERDWRGGKLYDDKYLVEAFAATQLFADIKVTEDPTPPSDSYLFYRKCDRSTYAPGMAGFAWLVTAFISPAQVRHHKFTCENRFEYVDPAAWWTVTTLHKMEQDYNITELANGFGVIPAIARGKKAEAYNPVAVANDTVNQVLWGLQ